MDKSYATSASERPLSERPLSEGVASAQIPANGSGNGNIQGGEGIREETAGISGGAGAARAERSRSDLFLLATFGFALIAWLVSLVSQAVVAATISDGPVRILWFGIIIQTILTITVGLVIMESSTYNAAYAYGNQISIFAAIATVFAVLGVDQNIYSRASAQQATGAGWLLVAIVDLLWIFFFTSPPQHPIFRFVTDSGPTRGQSPHHTVQKIGRSTDAFPMSPVNDRLSRGPSVPPQEQKPQSGVWSGSTSARNRVSTIPSEHRTTMAGDENLGVPIPQHPGAVPPMKAVSESTAPDSTAQWRAEALFDYKGSDEDPNELAFKKGEVLLVFDKSGKWWEAKTRGGHKGIAPSNYLRLL